MKMEKRTTKRRRNKLLNLIKVDKGNEGRGSAKVDKKFLYVNIINFAKVDEGGGLRRLSTKSG